MINSSTGRARTAWASSTLDLTAQLRSRRPDDPEGHRGQLLTDPSAIVLEKVVDYFHYWHRNQDKEDVPDMDIPVEMCLELLMAANYFNLDAKPTPKD